MKNRKRKSTFLIGLAILCVVLLSIIAYKGVRTIMHKEDMTPIALYENSTSLFTKQTPDISSVIETDFPNGRFYEERKKAEEEKKAKEEAERKEREEKQRQEQEANNQQPSTSVQIPQYHGDKIVCLTFDDGPGYGSTERILNTLKQYNIKATFFVLGQKVAQNPGLLMRMIAEGHTIGSHSYDHPDLTTLSIESMKAQLNSTDQQIIAAGGYTTNYLRPPYGSYNDAIIQAIDKKIILWNVDSNDWRNKQNPQGTVNNVMSTLQPHSLILFHDIYDSSATALEQIIPQLLENGYRFVSLEEYIQITGY